MNKQYDLIGKVCLTAEGIWHREKDYEVLSVVTDNVSETSYISRKNVPAGIDISNDEYWQPISSHVCRNNNMIILCDKDIDGNLINHTLESAIYSLSADDRKPGLILGFYGIDYSTTELTKSWFLFQYNSETTDDFLNVDKWTSLYNNINKFRGLFSTETELINYGYRPTLGDYAYVGSSIKDAILYMCLEGGKWTNTKTNAYEFANLYEAVGSKDFDDLEFQIDESYADRAEKDALGNVIHFTYVTKEGISNFVVKKVLEAIAVVDLPDESIELKHLSESLKDYINSGGAITNMPDEEDLTIEKDVLKFKDKEYVPTNFSGKGRKFLRKNMIDGINVIEQYMFDKPNTIYILQYDYCLNGQTIVIPENSTIRFQGGSVNGGTVHCNNTRFTGIFGLDDVGINIKLTGTYEIFRLVSDSILREYISEQMKDNQTFAEVIKALSENNDYAGLVDRLSELESQIGNIVREEISDIIEEKIIEIQNKYDNTFEDLKKRVENLEKNKVDKDGDKILTTNDFDNIYKDKLDSIEYEATTDSEISIIELNGILTN